MAKINEGHYLELLDRLHVITSNINAHLMNHPLTKKEKIVKQNIEKSLDILMDTYQIVGNLEYKPKSKTRQNRL